MVTLHSVHGHTGLTPPFLIFWQSGTLALRNERQSARLSKNEKSGLDQYGPERFGRLIFATIKNKMRDWKG